METEEVCDSLDKAVAAIFEILEDLYIAKAKLEEEMKEGFFQMSRSRYSLGVKRVNADQILDAELSCTRSVTLTRHKDDLGDASTEDDAHADKLTDLFELCCNISREKTTEDPDDVEIQKAINRELRRRGKKSEEETSSKKTPPSSESSPAEEGQGKKFVLSDPINLFGVLVPQSLKASQQSFINAVSLSVEIANLQVQLLALKKKYLRLKEQKETLVKTS